MTQSEPIDLTQKLADAKKQAAEENRRAHSASLPTGQAGAQTEDESPPRRGSDEVELLKKELEKMTELAKRTMADLQNLKRRQEEEKRAIIIMANADIMRSMLPILDNLERAFKHMPDSAKNDQTKEWIQGLEISAKQLAKALEDAGLKPIESLDKPFNPDLHEALAQGPGSKDTVIEELEKGYQLGDRGIRHAKVKVGNGED